MLFADGIFVGGSLLVIILIVLLVLFLVRR